MSSPSGYKIINCTGHGRPCVIKTGTNPSSTNFKKSFYLCCQTESCGFKKETLLEPCFCSAHPKEIVSQQTMKNRSGIPSIHYQCSVGRTKNTWCGVKQVATTEIPKPTDFSDLLPSVSAAKVADVATLSDSFTSYRDGRGPKPAPPNPGLPKPAAKVAEVAPLSDSFTSYRDARGTKPTPPKPHSNVIRIVVPPWKPFVIPKGVALHDLESELEHKKKLISSVNLDTLPDKGLRLKVQVEEMTKAISILKFQEKQKEQEIRDEPKAQAMVPAASLTAHQIKQIYPAQAVNNLNYLGGRSVMMEREVLPVIREAIEQLHKALETKPTELEETDDPEGLAVSLMRHQKQALTWLMWRETQHPSGGILADDMGLGKTLTMIALILKQAEVANQKKSSADDSTGRRVPPTLIVCPASILHHWEAEVKNRCRPGTLTVYVYHGANRSISARKLAEYGVVVTTYETVRGEVKATKDDDQAKNKKKSSGATNCLLNVTFARIVLDEGHIIKNAKTGVSESACRLRGTSRWVVTGTPIHNQLKDVYSFLRFLKFSPFEDISVWKYWVDNGTYQGQARLATVIKSILLRRTKGQNGIDGKPLVNIPPKVVENISLTLSDEERKIYNTIMETSKKSLMNYLKTHGFDKKQKENGSDEKGGPTMINLLVMLLRLQQCCCHMNLLGELVDVNALFAEDGELDALADKLSQIDLSRKAAGDGQNEADPLAADAVDSLKLKVTTAYQKTHRSTKISALMTKLEEIAKNSDPKNPTKSVVVSQWTSMLKIVALHLKEASIRFCEISGAIPIKDRASIVNDFNLNQKGPVVMLLSLKAGGVGLNLVGGSHLFLLDIHWNPALESQASDRIHRVGQLKEVRIYRFLCSDTVEERIDNLQKSKTLLAKNILEGQAAKISRPTLQDLKLLFSI